MAPKIDDNQITRKSKSAPFNNKNRNVPALMFGEEELESNIVDIDYKVIQEDPIQESQVTPTRIPDEPSFFEDRKIDEIETSLMTSEETKVEQSNQKS